ncbi:putative MscS family protein, partial [Neolecta irregularis DAH-3]
TGHHVNGNLTELEWEHVLNRILLSFFIAGILNLLEKLLMQIIAKAFHERTYEDRIILNKLHVTSFTKMFTFARSNQSSFFKSETQSLSMGYITPSLRPDGKITPKSTLNTTVGAAKSVIMKTHDVIGKVAGEITGTGYESSTSDPQIVLQMFKTQMGCEALARTCFKALCKPRIVESLDKSPVSQDTITLQDLECVFSDSQECEDIFNLFDQDLNGDITQEEMIQTCCMAGKDRKSIHTSLKDMDSVMSKLDGVFMFILLFIVILIFVSLSFKTAATSITTAGTTLLALSWLFQQAAQEFLASLIFVFVKHPFEYISLAEERLKGSVGDRVDLYINTEIMSVTVREINLMATELKKLSGEVIQAPNSLLNTLFVLNMRRSGSIAEPITITIKYGTTLEQISLLRDRMTEFVRLDKRDYKGDILTELRDFPEMFSLKLNVIFFHKGNWQNEGLRIARRNKFMCCLMTVCQELNIVSPRNLWPGKTKESPLYLQTIDSCSIPVSCPSPSQDHPMSPSVHLAPASRSRTDPIPEEVEPEMEQLVKKPVDFTLGAKSFVANDNDAFGSGTDSMKNLARRHRARSNTTGLKGGESRSPPPSTEIFPATSVRRYNTFNSNLARSRFEGILRRKTTLNNQEVVEKV